jgi:FSR family fosmidomycin resistance protein-like MFS transporter
MIGQVAGERVGTGMSIFMAGGELGRAVGPLVLVAGIEWFGLGGMWRLAIIGWLVSAILYFRLHDIAARPRPKDGTSFKHLWPKIRRIFTPLTVIMITRAFITVALSTYLPLFMSDVVGSSLWLAAASLTILEGAGVVGALMTGTLSDRLGRVRMLLFLLGISPLLLFGFLYAPSWLAVPLLLALGLTAISPAPVLLAVVQDNFTENRALANGIYMGINFLTYAIGVSAIGLIADQLGLFNAFLSSGVIALFALPAVLRLPN